MVFQPIILNNNWMTEVIPDIVMWQIEPLFHWCGVEYYTWSENYIPVTTNVGLMLIQRRRRWANIKPALE